jgi:hypothetical protein
MGGKNGVLVPSTHYGDCGGMWVMFLYIIFIYVESSHSKEYFCNAEHRFTEKHEKKTEPKILPYKIVTKSLHALIQTLPQAKFLHKHLYHE